MPYSFIEKEIDIPQLQRKRRIRVAVPEGYEKNSEVRYPVLYLQDAQNLFRKEDSAFGTIWQADAAAAATAQKLNLPGIIIVGVDCNVGIYRLDEYSPWVNPSVAQFTSNYGSAPRGGKGDRYADFIVNTLKPMIDETYRTRSGRDSTWIGGSSMGALISLYAGFKFQNVFSGILAMSTAIWFAKAALFSFVRSIENLGDTTVYLDIGTRETSDDTNSNFPAIYVNDSRELYQLLRDRGVAEEKVKLVIEEGAPHNEDSWARRLPAALAWLVASSGTVL